MIAQLGIAIFGVAAVWLSQDPDVKRRRWAPVCGLIGQPFWIYESAHAGQWGILALCALYTWSWWRGFRAHWLRGEGA